MAIEQVNKTRRMVLMIAAGSILAPLMRGNAASAEPDLIDKMEASMANTFADPTFYDRMAIRELIETYADRLNHADWVGYAQTLAEDIEFRVSAPDTLVVHGRDNLVKLVSEGYKGGFVHQMAHNIVVDRVNGDRARARHTLHIVSAKFRIIALYYDALVRTGEGWKFAKRDVQITYKEVGPLPGEQYRTLPDPENPAWFVNFD